MNAFLKLTHANLRAFFRDRSGLFFSFFLPIFFVVIFGSLFGRENRTSKFAIGVVLEDTSPEVAWAPSVFQKIPIFNVTQGTLAAETEALRAGKRRAVVVFPRNLAQRIQAGQTSEVKVLYDPSQQQAAQIVTGVVRQVIDGMDKRLNERPTLLTTREEPMQSAKNKRLRGIDFLLPGILAMTIMQLGLFTALPLITMREKGILKRLRATPLPRWTLVGSQITQRLIIGVLQTVILIGVGSALFKFHVAGSWPALFGVVVLGVLTFICLGAVLSAFAKTQESGVPLVQMVNLPLLFLSGLLFPPEILPAGLQPVMNALPSTYLGDALRQVMLAAPPVHPLPVALAVLGAWMVGGAVLAARLFRWE